MGLSIKDQKILWGRAAGRCSHRNCGLELIAGKTELDPAVITGEMAHIIAKSKRGPRGQILNIDENTRDSYENAILLCERHHKIVDGQRNTYTVEVLKQMKEKHERLVKDNPHFRKMKIYPIKWVVFIQQYQKTIDKKSVLHTLKPDLPYYNPVEFCVDPAIIGWKRAKQHQESIWKKVLSRLPSEYTRFAIFSLTHIPLAIHLGYLINDRYRVRIYEYQRDAMSWSWPPETKLRRNNKLFVKGLPKRTIRKSKPVIIRVSMSAKVSEHLTNKIVPTACVNIHLYVKNPEVNKIKQLSQVDNLGVNFRDSLSAIRKHMPDCSGIHLFYSGPCSGAVNIGRQINPTMNPPVYLYQYNVKAQRKHKCVLTLK
jgi:hypothetical protein